jgi:hypothetical protein
VGLLAFDRGRLESLRAVISGSLDELRLIRSDDAAADDARRMVSGACRTLGDEWLPRVQAVLNSTSMTSCTRSAVGVADVSQALTRTRPPDGWKVGWEVGTDPMPVLGPPAPRNRSFDEVLADVRSGSLVPIDDPLDANGRAGAHYTSLSFASGPPQVVGSKELTSNMAKLVDFGSDGLLIGWRESQTLTIYHLSNARVTSTAHVLNAYDSNTGPEALPDLTTEATVSGYMIIKSDQGKAEVNMQLGTGDPTQSQSVFSESTSSYSGMFFPDEPVELQPTTDEDRVEDPDLWTFTKSASPMVDEWGTWGL